MTWGEFKKFVEDYNVKDTDVIDFIDVMPHECEGDLTFCWNEDDSWFVGGERG